MNGLEKLLKEESNKKIEHTPFKIYKKMGLSFNNKKLKDIENRLFLDSKKIVIDKKGDIFEALGIDGLENKSIEKKLRKDKKHFSPQIKNNIYSRLNIKIPLSTKIINAAKSPIVITVSSLLILSLAVGLPFLLNVSNDDDEINLYTPTVNSGIDLEVVSASKKYITEVIFSIKNDGTIDSDDIFTNDDDSAYILDSIESSDDNKKIKLTNKYNPIRFVKSYLTSALNHGYIEKRDISQENQINLTFSYGDEAYFKNSYDSFHNSLKKFIYSNKIVASINISKKINWGLSENSLLAKTYLYTTKLLKNSNEHPLIMFSDIPDEEADWLSYLDNIKQEDIEYLYNYLINLDDSLNTIKDRENFLKSLDIKCNNNYRNLENLNDLISMIDRSRDYLITNLLERVNDANLFDLLKETKETNIDNKLINFLNDKFNNELPLNYEPSHQKLAWKWYLEAINIEKNGINTNKEDFTGPKFEEINNLIHDLQNKYKEESSLRINEESLYNVYCDHYLIESKMKETIDLLNESFDIVNIEVNEHKFHSDWNDGDKDHSGDDTPIGWEKDFDKWWKSNNH